MTTGARDVSGATMWLRSLAATIDVLIVGVAFNQILRRWGHPLADGNQGVEGWPAYALFAAVAAYWIVPEWLCGLTLGKFICRVRVVSALNKPLTFSQIFKRNLLRPIEFFPFLYLVAFIVAMFNPLRQRLGDQWAKTVVVPIHAPDKGPNEADGWPRVSQGDLPDRKPQPSI